MKKTLLTNLKFIAFGLVVAAGISVAAAGTWNGPTATAPANNVDVPIHVGPDQRKTTGNCTSFNCGGLSVGAFSVFQNAEFDDQVYFNGMIRGGAPIPATTDSKVTFGDGGHLVNGVTTGDLNATGALQSQAISNTQSTPVCAASDGTIYLCGGTPPAAPGSYVVYSQKLVYPMPDYAYTASGPRYIVNVCLNGAAKRPLSFTVNYTDDGGRAQVATATVRSGQTCSDLPSSQSSIEYQSAPHTIVGDAQLACTYEGSDTTYQAPPYQGYAVTVDRAVRCQ
jgi:hypothetical protein